MIRFEDVTGDCGTSVSFEIGEGVACNLVTASDCEEGAFLETILAMKPPSSGRVFVLEEDVYSLPEQELLDLYRKVGVAWRDGGLISNLKVWENIVLPVRYHLGKQPSEVEDRVVDLFRQLGIEVTPGYLGALPGVLTPSERSLVGLVREMVMDPPLMIYDGLYEGLHPETAGRLVELAATFHAARPDRTSIFIGSNEASMARVAADITIRAAGKRLHV
ncbi:MAG: hypothetical protein PVF51_08740 [Nitrospirota bacterium]